MSGTRDVLIVERTAAARDALARLLDAQQGIRVVGLSADADAALRMVARTRPCLVLLGVDLPGAAQLTRRIMADQPTPIVVLAEPEDVAAGGALLAEGALSVQLRPRDAAAGRRFPAVIAALAQVSVVRRRGRPADVRPSMAPIEPRERGRIVGVAASTGGPVALQQLFAKLPSDLPVPVVVVQHLAVGFTAGLVSTLQLASPLPIKVPQEGSVLDPGVIYIAPDGRHLSVTRSGRTRLHDDPPVSGFRPSATVLFSSLAAAYGPAAIAVVLTGMGTDGLTGLHEVHAEGGYVLAQDEATAVVFGMPGAAVGAGIADVSAPVEELAAHIASLTKKGED